MKTLLLTNQRKYKVQKWKSLNVLYASKDNKLLWNSGSEQIRIICIFKQNDLFESEQIHIFLSEQKQVNRVGASTFLLGWFILQMRMKHVKNSWTYRTSMIFSSITFKTHEHMNSTSLIFSFITYKTHEHFIF